LPYRKEVEITKCTSYAQDKNTSVIGKMKIVVSIILCIVGVVSAIPSLPSTKHLPPYLSHIDNTFLQSKLDLAMERHEKAIQKAITNFDTDSVSASTYEEREKFLNSLQFDEYNIVADGYHLPDFHDELGNKSVFVTKRETPMFTKEECDEIIQKAEEYYSSVDEDGQQREWPKMESGQYYVQGFFIKDGPPEIKEWFTRMVKTRLFEALNYQFPDFCDGIDNLVVDNAYMFKYIHAPGLRTEIHTDQGCLSFTFALNSNSEYKGGGTFVEGLTKVGGEDDSSNKKIIEMDIGQCTVRPGGIRHGGNPLESGTRYIIGGFCMHKKKVEVTRQLMDNPCSSDATLVRDCLEAAIAFNPRCDLPYANLAHIYEKEGYQTKALDVVKDCLHTANPHSCSASYYLGTIGYYQTGDYEKAIDCMNICLGVDPKDGDALQTLYQSYSKLGNTQEESNVLKRLVKTPGVSNRVLANAHCNLGTLCDDIDTEIEHYLKAIDCDSTSISTWHSFGSALSTSALASYQSKDIQASQNNFKQAVAAYRKAIDLIDSGTGRSSEDDFSNLTNDDIQQQRKETLDCLYRSATLQMRTEMELNPQPGGQPPHDVLMDKLKNIMGEANCNELMRMKMGS